MSVRRTRSGSRFESLPDDDEGDNSFQTSPSRAQSISSQLFTSTPVPSHDVTPLRRPKRRSPRFSSLRTTLFPGSDEQTDDPGNDLFTLAQSSSRSQSFPSYQRSIPVQQFVRSRTASAELIPRTVEQPSGLEFDWDHFGKELQTIDDSGLEGTDIFEEEETGFETPTNITEDINILQSIEFIIEYNPKGKLGAGLYGVVFRGYYGQTIEGFENVDPSRRYAVKIVDFGDRDTYVNRHRREKFETEKYVLTDMKHRNIVTIKMIINMGEQRTFPFEENPDVYYVSADRQYLFMDFADEGELKSFLTKYRHTIEPSLRINLIRDLFFGLLYLHSNSIVHGDVHTGNVLIFTENEEKVAKWSDFGLSYVGTDRAYRYNKPPSFESETFHASYMRSENRIDIQGMLKIFAKILENRNFCRTETPEETSLLDDCKRMIDESKYVASLLEIYNNFTHILVDELVFDENYFT